KEKGLEPFAEQILSQAIVNPEEVATEYFSEEHELTMVEDVIAGANDIIAEIISDDPAYRDYIRETTWKLGEIETTLKEADKDEKEIFQMYYEYKETIRSLVSHRTLAINRGEKEDVLRVKVVAPVDRIIA